MTLKGLERSLLEGFLDSGIFRVRENYVPTTLEQFSTVKGLQTYFTANGLGALSPLAFNHIHFQLGNRIGVNSKPLVFNVRLNHDVTMLTIPKLPERINPELQIRRLGNLTVRDHTVAIHCDNILSNRLDGACHGRAHGDTFPVVLRHCSGAQPSYEHRHFEWDTTHGSRGVGVGEQCDVGVGFDTFGTLECGKQLQV